MTTTTTVVPDRRLLPAFSCLGPAPHSQCSTPEPRLDETLRVRLELRSLQCSSQKAPGAEPLETPQTRTLQSLRLNAHTPKP